MARIRANNASGGGGTINPTVVQRNTLQRGQTSTWTIDPSKDYLFCADYRYGDATWRGDIQYIHDGTVDLLTNNYSASYILPCTISGTTLTYGSDTSGSYYLDYTLIQLD